MTRKTTAYRARLLLTAGALCLFTLSALPVQAQDARQLQQRLNQLENEIQTLSRAVYRGDTAPRGPVSGGATSGADAAAMANIDIRLSGIEDRQRTMTGQVEQLTYDVQQMKDRLEKSLADTEMRLQALERGVAVGRGGTPVVTGDLYATDTVQPRGADILKPPSSGTLGTVSQTGSADPASALYEDAFSDIREARYDKAEAKLKKFMSIYSTHPLAGNAQYWLAETYYVRGDYSQSARMFAQGYQDYPQGNKAADSLLKLGLSLDRLGKKDDACLSYQQLKKEFPEAQNPVTQRGVQEMKRLGCR